MKSFNLCRAKKALLVLLSAAALSAEEPAADAGQGGAYHEEGAARDAMEPGGGSAALPSAASAEDAGGRSGSPSGEERPDGGAAEAPERKDIGISGVEKEAVQRYIRYYLSDRERKWLSSVLYDSIPYRPYVRQELTRRGLPMFLQYLPIVESNYKPTAVSSSGAVGIWQFMENSMSPYMIKNEYLDERRDPWKETDAALSKLTDNYNIFKDWHLAIAAYNMGAGAISRILRANPGKDYWALAEEGLLSEQTREYVPRLIAVTEIIENAAHYGALEIGVVDSLIDGAPAANFSYLRIHGCIHLDTVAAACGIPLETVRALNVELLHDYTPPDTSYTLRLPPGKAQLAARVLSGGE